MKKELDQGERHLEAISGLEKEVYGNTKTLDLFWLGYEQARLFRISAAIMSRKGLVVLKAFPATSSPLLPAHHCVCPEAVLYQVITVGFMFFTFLRHLMH